MVTKSAGVAGMVCALALAVSACGGSTGGGGGGSGAPGGSTARAALVSGGTLTELIPSDPGSLNPFKTVNTTTIGINHFLYDPLVNELESGRIVSGLATSWHPMAHGETFTLRQGVTCSDGSTLRPSTVAANINYIADPKNASPLVGVYVPAGLKAAAHGSTVTVSSSQPTPFLLQGLANVGIVCAKGLTHPSILAHGSDGTGPFVISSAVAGQQYNLTVRHGYAWGPDGASTAAAGIPAKLVVKVVASSSTEANLLLQGGANIASVIGLANKPLTSAGLFKQSASGPLGELWFDEAPGHPEASEAVRQALTEALNLPQVGSVFGQGEGTPATGMVSVSPKPCAGSTTTGNVPSYNPAAAERLLTQAGWKPGAGGVRSKGGKPLSLTVYYPTDIGGDPSSAFELAAQEWSKVGVKVTLKSDTSVALENIVLGGGGAWDMVDLPLGVDTPTQVVPFVSGAPGPKGQNFGHIDNQGYNSLATSAAMKSGTSGCPEWNRAEVALFKAADVIPFEYESSPTFGKSVTFSESAGDIFGTSLRLRKG